MNPWQRIAAIVLLGVYLVPIWGYPLFPSQDGPSHLYNTVIFCDLLWNPHSFWSAAYQIHWAPFPNWTFTLLAALMYPLVPLVLVEKIILSLYVAGFVGAVFYFVRSVDAQKSVLGFAGFLFVYNWFLWMGFYNFCLSIPLALVTIGYAVRHRGFIYGRRLYWMMFLFLVLYLSHIVSFALTLIVVAGMFCGFGQRRGRALLEVVLTAAPALVLFAIQYFTQPRVGSQTFWAPFAYLAGSLFSFKIGPWFRAWEVGWLVALWVVLGTWLFLTGKQMRAWSMEERIWWLVVAVVAALSLAAPYNLLGGTSLNERLSIFVGLFLLPTLSVRRWSFPKAWLAAAFVVLVVAQQLYLHLQLRDWNRRLEPFEHLGRIIAPNAKVLSLLYAENVVGIYPDPLLHADSLALAESRSLSPNNYEAFTTYFPTRYKAVGALPIPAEWYRPDAFLEADLPRYYDYVIVWKAARPLQDVPALRGFVTIYSQDNLALLKHR